MTGLLLACFSLWTVRSGAADGAWNIDLNGNWTGTPANWVGSVVPNGVGDVATFRNDITAARTITLDAPITLGGLRLGDLLGSSVFTFAGSSALTFNNGLANAFFSKFGGATDVWQAPLILNSDLDWNIFAGTLDVTGVSNAQVSYTGTGDTIKNGAGALRLNLTTAGGYTGDWVLNFGTLNLGGVNGAAPTSLGTGTGGILLNGTGRADLAIFSLNNNGTADDSTIVYAGNNDVGVKGGATLNVDRNYIGGAFSRVTHTLDSLDFQGGVLRVTSGNSHVLAFNGPTVLHGETNVFDVQGNGTATLANLTLNGAVTSAGAGGGIIKEGAGRMRLTNIGNTQTGVNAVKNGVLELLPGAKPGTGTTFINGGALSVQDTATLDGVSAEGLVLVGQLGTTRFALPTIAYSGFVGINSLNPLDFDTPIAGAILGVDGVSGTSSLNSADIDLDYVGGGSQRVWLGNVLGFDRTYQGTLTNSGSFGMAPLRLTAGSNSFIISGSADRIGGAGAMNEVIFGFDHQNAIGFTGNVVTQAAGGTVSVRVDNASSLGPVTVNRGVTVNINGTIFSPLGAGAVTALGGAISTDNASLAQFGNTDFRLYGGSTLTLDNSNVTTANANRRLQISTDIDLTSSTLRQIGDGGAATVSSQSVNSVDFQGGATVSVDTDGTTAGRLTTLTTGSLNRVGRGTLNLRNIANTATTFGTVTGTQKLIITAAPAVTNDMIGADIVLWGGANANDGSLPTFTTYDATHGIQPATFDLTATSSATANTSAANGILDISGLAGAITGVSATAQAVRIRSTSNTHTVAGTLTIGSVAAVGQGAGLSLAHTANNGLTHALNVNIGTQEGLLYVATTGGTSGVIGLSGVISGSNGLTRFGDGILSLTGANTFTGPLTINSGETRASQNSVGLATPVAGTINPGAPKEVDLWGGSFYIQSANARYNTNVNFYNDARFGDVNVGAAAVNNITIQPRVGSTAPVVAWFQDQAGGNFTFAMGGLELAGPAQLAVVHPVVVQGAVSGAGTLEKYMNDRLYIGGDSSGYSAAVTAYAGSLQSNNASGSAKPFGTGPITLNPGSMLRIAAPTNLNANQLTLNSDHGGISGLGLTFVADPATSLPAFAVNSTSPWRGFFSPGAVGFDVNLNQSTLFGGDTYLGAIHGDLAVYTGVLSPASGSRFLLGSGQGTLRIDRALTGGNSAVIGISMTGDQRADQAVNNSASNSGVVQFDVPMTYTGDTILNSSILRLHHPDALAATGNIIGNGGYLRHDTNTGQVRFNAPINLGNDILMRGDFGIHLENAASDFILDGDLSLSSGAGSTGLVRTLSITHDGNNVGNVILNGGIIDGAGSSGGHFVKAGYGTLFLKGTNTFGGTLTVTGGLLGVNADADFGNASQIILPGGGLGIFENSFASGRNISFHGGNGWLDVAAGLTFTQLASSTYDGTSFIMKRGLGTAVLNGTNAQVGLLVADGILQVNSQEALGNAAETGADRLQFGGDFSPGSGTASRHMGGTLRIDASTAPLTTITTNRGLSFNNNGSNTLGGGVDVVAGSTFQVNGVAQQGSEADFATKSGAGTLIVTGTNTWRQIAMTHGTLQFAHNQPWLNNGASGTNTTLDFLGGTIRAVNTGANIAVANGASTTTYNYGGGMHLRMASGAGFSVLLDTDNLLRVNQGTLVLETEGATLLGGASASNSARVLTVNAINSGVARASAMTNGIFAAHLIGADPSGSAFFLENDVTNGFKEYGGVTTSTLSGLNAAGIGNITSDPALTGTDNSIYAFRTTSDITGGTLRIAAIDNLRMGGILINGSHTISSNLIFDPTSATAPGIGTIAEAAVYVKTGESATLGGNITANALTKFGRGTLTLSGTNLISGDVSVQDGTLRLNGGSPFSVMNSELNLNAGASLDLNGTSVTVETLGSNNRTVNGENLGVVGGQVTNTSGATSTLSIANASLSIPTQNFAGTIDGNLRLMKAGGSVLNIDGHHPGTPDAGNNTFTGGTAIYGVALGGGINLNNTTFGLGGYNGASMGDVDLYSGTLGLLFSGNWLGVPAGTAPLYNNLTVKYGQESGLGMAVNVKGNAAINVNQVAGAGIGQGNLLQIGALNMSNNTLVLTGGNLYRLKVAGTTTIEGSQATFQFNSDSTGIQLDGQVTGGGAINKTGDATFRTLIFSNPANDFSGGLNILGGDVQNPNPSANTLGSGPVRIFPDGSLRIAGNSGVIGANLQTLSRVNAMGAVVLDENFTPTVLSGGNFSSVYNTTLQLGQQMFSQALDLAAIGDGRAFLGSGLNTETKYLAPTLGAGLPDDWNPGVGVYRLVGGLNNLGLDGPNNVLTGNSFLQLGSRRNMVVGAPVNGGNGVIVRNSNNFTGGTQVAEGTILYLETGGSPVGETPLGTGAVEIYGQLRLQGSLGSLWKADANAGAGGLTNTINLRPGGLLYLIDGNAQGNGGNLVAGGQGRWGDNVGIDLNGGSFRFDGAVSTNSVETVGTIDVRKGGALQVFRNNTNSSAQLTAGGLNRIAGGTLSVSYNAGFLGTNLTAPMSFERLLVTGGVTRTGNTNNGATVVNGGIAPVWIVDATANTYLGYDPTGTGTGFQALRTDATAPGAGELSFSTIGTALPAGTGLETVNLTGAATLTANSDVWALRATNNIANTAPGGFTITTRSGGLLLTGGTINATINGLVSPMTINFGVAGAGEAIIYNGGNATVQAQLVAAQGLTKFGGSTLTLNSINPGIDGPVTINTGTIVARVPFSGTGTPLGAGNGVFGGQDVILNGGGLQLDPFLANAAGTASEIAANVRSSAVFDSHIRVRGDANLNNNGQAQLVRISDLTFENGGGASAMNENGVISLALQSGIWVGGTTTLIPQAVFNQTVNQGLISTFGGQVTGAADLEKFGNGTIALLNGTNNYSGGTTIWGATGASQVSTIASGFRGVGTPFGTGAITVNPGALLRIADTANIAANAVTLKSDGIGLAGLGIGYNGALPTIITSGTPLAGQIKIESTGPFAGVIGLDYGYYDKALDMAAIPGGDWWLGNSTQAEAYYFNGSLGAAANGKYLLGGGGASGILNLGSVSIGPANTRVPLFENIFSGGTANTPRVEIGALTAALFANGPSFVNGNSSTIVMVTRNTGLVGDTRVNTNTTLALGNNFALGSGRLVLNGGGIRADFGPNNAVTSNLTLDNNVLLQGDFTTNSGGEIVFNGNVAMHDGTAGATRIWNLTQTTAMAVGLTAGSATNGVISGAVGSNLIKRGAQLVSFRGANSYQGYTQIDRGEIVVVGDVSPGVNGPLGNSVSPIVLGLEGTNLAGSLGIGGKYTIGRDILVTSAPGTGINLIQARTNERAIVTGGISIATGAILTLGAQSGSNVTNASGVLEIRGGISGAGAVTFGTTAAATSFGGIVALTGNSNGYGINTYSGGSTFASTRVQIGSDTLFSGPVTAPTILSGPLGTGAMTWTSGEGGNGFSIEAIGGSRTIVNAFAATSSAANANFRFTGHEAMTFTRDWNMNSDGTLRNRVILTNNLNQPLTLSGNLSGSGAQGTNFIKQGAGMLVLTGTNSQANLLTTDGNYGTGVFIDHGILRVNGDAALGSSAALAAAGSHLLGPADVRLRGGVLSISSGFTTARQFILTAASGIDVAAGQTLAATTQTAGAFGLTKSGPGTLALNNSANTITALVLGGQQRLNPNVGLFSHTGGVVSTTATTGTPFATASVTIHSGTLSLADAAAQTLTVPTVTYGAAGEIAINGADVFTATALARGNSFNSVNYGTLILQPSALANLGGVGLEQITTGTAQPTLNGTLVTPSVLARLAGANQAATFVTFGAPFTGFGQVTYSPNSLGAGSALTTDLIDVGAAGDSLDAASTGVYALRTAGNITIGTGSSLNIGNGGLIMNPGAANAPATIDPALVFGTGATPALLAEAIVYVADTTGASSLAGNLAARDFTKTGPGAVALSGGTNVLNTNATRLPVMSVQNGILRFANAGAQFTNGNRPVAVNAVLGNFVLNVNESGIFDLNGFGIGLGGLTGNGTVTSSVPGAVTLTAMNGFGVDTTFAGTITDGSGTVGLTKTGNGILTLTGHNAYSGETKVQAGRVTNSIGSAAALGRLEVQKVTSLGTGPVTLEGGTLTLNAAAYLGVAQTTNEVSDGIDVLLWGGASGSNVTVSNLAFSNGIALPANTSSVLNAAAQNSLIGSLTVNAPIVTSTAGLIFVGGSTTFNQDTVIRTAGGRVFLQGRVDAGGYTLTKTGANDVVLSHTEGGLEQNSAGLWRVYGGILNARSADGASNPLGANATVEINGGTTNYGLFLHSDGDGTAATEMVTTYADTNLRFGSMLGVSSNAFVSSGAGRIQIDRILGNNDDKTFVMNNLESAGVIGAPYVSVTGANGANLFVNGTTTFTRDFFIQNDLRTTLNGVISGNGTFVKRAGTDLFINAVSTYTGGTVLGNAGTTIFGSLEGNQVTLNATAKLGGQVLVNPNARLIINGMGNVQSGQTFAVGGNLTNFGVLGIGSDASLDSIGYRAMGAGGIQNPSLNYYTSASNPSGSVLAINTVYTQVLNQKAMGNGMGFIGSTTNYVGANGLYDAASMLPGTDNTYRLGAGGSTLFVGQSNANVLSNVGPVASSLVIGAPLLATGSGAALGNGAGTVVLLGNNNYTGTTVVNRGSTLDFRGSLTSSAIENYGTLNAAGEGGTFIGSGLVTNRPGSILRLDNYSAGVLPISSTEGRWGDATVVELNNSTLRMQGNHALETAETVGGITTQGGSFIEIVRGVHGRGTEIRTPSITRVNNGTIQFNTNGDQLGTDERLIITGAAPVVTNGMVAPWMVSNTNAEFLTYNADTGFSKAGFDRTQAAATLTSSVTATANRTLFTGAVALNAGVDFSTHALRLDADVTLGTATDNTAQLILGSGGLIVNGARTIRPGIVAGSIGTPTELLLYNNNNAVIGDGAAANRNTAGQIVATTVTKFGGGTMFMDGNQQTFNGDIRVQQGGLSLRWFNGTETNPIAQSGGVGSTIIMEGANTVLSLAAGQDNLTGNVTFLNSVVLGDYNPFVQLAADRAGGAITNRRAIIANNFSFGANNAETGQIVRYAGGNTFDLQIGSDATDNLNLVGKSTFHVLTSGADVFVDARTTGAGTLIMGGGGGLLQLSNVTNLNDYSGGTVVMGSTLQIFARAPNVAVNATTNITSGGAGTGDITLLGGTLRLLVDNNGGGAPDTNLERTRFGSAGNGPNLVVAGAATLNVDRTGLIASGTTKQIGLNNLTIGSQILTVSGGNSYGAEISGTTTMLGNMFVNTGTDFVLKGAIGDGGAGLFINKVGTGVLWVGDNNNSATSPNGGIFVQAGRLDFGDRIATSATATLGVGKITINPGAEIVLRGLGNINTVAGQKVVLTSTAYSPSVFLPVVAATQAQLVSMLQSSTPASNENQILAYNLSFAAANDYDQSLIGNGRVFFGNNAAISFTGTGTGALAPGLANLADSVIGGASTNRVYRLGGRTQNTLTIDLAGAGNLGDVGGPTDVQIGSLANLGPSANWGLAQVLFADQNTYTGQTVVSRASILRFSNISTATAGPLGGLTGGFSSAAINVYGTLQVEGTGSFREVVGTANAYSNINLRPGSSLIFLDNNATTANNRWDNGTALNLDGARFTLDAANNVDLSAETIGAISFDRGARIQTVNQGTSEILLTAASITRAAASAGAGTGRGTMVFTPANTANLGLASATNNAEQVRFTAAPAAASGALVGLPAGQYMLPGYYIDGTGNRFVRYNPSTGGGTDTGVVPVADGQMVAFTAGMTAGTAVVNAGAVTLPDFNPFIYALRASGNIASPTGNNNDATITFGGSSADIGALLFVNGGGDNTTVNIFADLKFGSSGGNEALIYFANPGGTNRTATLSGNITAAGITKFGTGLLNIASDQSDAARGNGQGYQGGWVINEGSINLQTFGSAGNAHANNTIVLNGNQVSTPTLFLRANPADSLLNYTYTSGKIIVVDNGVIDYDPGADDRVHSIAAIEIQQSGGIGNGPANGTNDAQLRIVNNRQRNIVAAGQLTLTNNAILNVDSTYTGNTFAAVGNNNTYLTNGGSNGMSVASLAGSARLTKWGDGYLYIRGDSAGFSGPVVIDQGAIGVAHSGALGSGVVTVNRYGVLDILVPGFTKIATFNEGSIERWSINGARSGTINLGKASLQVGADQNQTVTVTLDGGTIEGWTRTDDIANNATSTDVGVFRNLGPNVSIGLAGNSFVGNPYFLGANGLDSGRQTNDYRPIDENIGTGATLVIHGAISGTGRSLTKVGYDTVILAGANTYDGGTVVSGGTLKIGRENALAATGSLSTYANGVLDLNGYNQAVGSLTNPVDLASNVSATNNGYITNSAYGIKTLTAGNASNSTYRGVIQHNVALTKAGLGTLRLNNNNTYFGKTTANGGILEIAGSLSGTSELVLNTGGKILLNSSTGANNIVNTLADVTMNGGTLDLDSSQTGKTHTFRDLSVLGLSELDFGAHPGGGNTFIFEKLVQLLDVLKVNGWTGAVYPTSATMDSGVLTQDRFLFNLNPGFAANTPINNITFFNDAGTSIGRGLQVNDGARFGIVPTFMDSAYWKGNLASNAWNVGNWTSDEAGTNITGVAPTGNTDVYLSATGEDDQDNMELGEDMDINSLTVNALGSGSDVVLQSTGGYALTINAPTAVTTTAGSPAATIHAPVTFGASNATVSVSSANPLTFTGAIGGTSITKAGAGTMILTGAGVYTGSTTVNGGILQLGNGGATGSLPATSAISVAAGATFAINRNDTVTQGSQFSGAPITGAGSLRQAGTGTTVLTAANTYTGTTTITGGKLSISSESNIGGNPSAPNAAHLNINGGTLVATETFSIDDANRGVSIGASGGTIEVDATKTLTVANVVSGAGNFVKAGDGTLTFTGANTYAGSTTVADGILLVKGNQTAATGDITVSSGATLGGNGTLGGDTSITGSLSSGATAAAGSVGTLNFGGNDLAFNDTSTWLVDLVQGFSPSSDLITGIGNLEINGTTKLALNFINSYGGANVFTIANYTGLLSGEFYSFNGSTLLSNNGIFDETALGGAGAGLYRINYGSGAITLTAVPEPGTLGLLGLALAGFFTRRIRRRRAEAALVESIQDGKG